MKTFLAQKRGPPPSPVQVSRPSSPPAHKCDLWALLVDDDLDDDDVDDDNNDDDDDDDDYYFTVVNDFTRR